MKSWLEKLRVTIKAKQSHQFLIKKKKHLKITKVRIDRLFTKTPNDTTHKPSLEEKEQSRTENVISK